jgi:glycosyltransferase involved in cell wall biosynthesis
MSLPERQSDGFEGRLGIQQRVLPAYRARFFDLLSQQLKGGLSVFAGEPLPKEEIPLGEMQPTQRVYAHNWHFRDPSSAFYFCWQRGLLGWLKEWDAQVLIVEANVRILSTWRAIRWMHERGRAVIGWGLGAGRVGSGINRQWAMMRARFIQGLDGVIAYSHKGAQEYHQMGIPEERIFVAPNAAAKRPVGAIPQRPPLFGRANILFVGRLQARKRLELLFEACATLPVEIQPSLVIVGDGPARLQFEKAAGRLYPQTQFLGAKHGFELDALFDAADLFVLPGTGGLAVQQALAHALPVVVAQGDGTQDAMVTPANGWSVPSNHLPVLSEVLLEALSDLPRLRRMGEESFRIAREEVNLERMADVFLQAVSSISPK